MKSMKELVLSRLIDQYQMQVDQWRTAFERSEIQLNASRSECKRVTEMLRKFRDGETPIRGLYEAAEKVYSAQTTDDRKKAISRLGSALTLAEKYVDVIPF
ncbi:hypothetical protein [Bradyrhizobium sp.]